MPKPARAAPIAPGERYRQRRPGLAVATALVLGIDDRPQGIPHVHYELSLTLPSGTALSTERNRTVALDRFVDLFPIRI